MGESVLHHQQFSSVRGQSAVDVLYNSVMEAREPLGHMCPVGCAFWDVKGGFQNVQSLEVLPRMVGCHPLRCWNTWLERFMSSREFEVAWDSKVRGQGVVAKGVPQGSWLSSVPFMVYMAPMLEEMER